MNFFNNLITACELKSLNPKKIAEACGVSKNTFKNWEKGMIPNAEMIVKLSTHINISTDYLLLGKEPTIPTEYQQLIESYNQLSKDNKQLLQAIISSMINIQIESKNIIEKT